MQYKQQYPETKTSRCRDHEICICLYAQVKDVAMAYQNHGQCSDSRNCLASLGMGDNRADKKADGLGSKKAQQHSCPVGKEGPSIVPTRQHARAERQNVAFRPVWMGDQPESLSGQ